MVNKSIGWPNGLAIDYQERKLYWGDAKLDFIASINLDGTNRINFLERKVPHAFGIAVLGDGIFWTDWQLRTLNRLDKHTKKVTKVLENRADLMGIKAVDIHLAYGDNPCKINNGDCSHLCFFKPSGHKCSCPLGMELGKDDKTCITPNGFLLISRRNDIRRVTLDTYKRDVVIPLNQVREASSLGFDISEERIYWVDNAKDLKAIYSAFMNGTGIKAVVRFGLEMPGTIAVDWIAKNIYWTDEKANRIEVARTDGRHRKVLLWENIVQPFTLAVNPHNG